jgi:hypothetical protein
MRIDKETNKVFVRQSWLKDMLLCPERARLGVVQPEFKTQNDSAAIGTAVHAGIEAVLAGNASVTDAPEVSLIKFKELESVGVNHTNVNPDSWHNHVLGLTKAWVNDILPRFRLAAIQKFHLLCLLVLQQMAWSYGLKEQWTICMKMVFGIGKQRPVSILR